jgi:hypothetical protein
MHVLLDQQHRLPAVGAGAEGRVSARWFRREGDVRGAGFNANVESAIWYAPGSERRSEMRRTILALVVALALWPIPASAVDLIVFGLKTTSDLLAVCATPESDAVHKEAIHYCFGYLEGAVGYHNALSTHKDMKRLTCYPEGTTREDGVRAFIRWAQAHQNDTKLMSEAPGSGLMRSLSATNRIPKGD